MQHSGRREGLICCRTMPDRFVVGECMHALCVSCTVMYVRSALGNVADDIHEGGLRCPQHNEGCTDMLDLENIQKLVDRTIPSDQDHVPFAADELGRLTRFVFEARIPHDLRFYCRKESCSRMFELTGTESRVVCPFCNTASCRDCKVLWHGALTCQEVQSMGKHQTREAKQSQKLIDATSKACPNCGTRITHYHGMSVRALC